MRPTWFVRRAVENDTKEVEDLQKRTHRPQRSDSEILEYFVAISDHKIVGCAAVRERNKLGYLYGLVVDKPWRKKGIGHALTQERLDWLRGTKASSAFVMSMFWNIKFFEKHGFTVANKKKNLGLQQVHKEFTDAWSNRSCVMAVELSSSIESPEVTRRIDGYRIT